MSLKSKEKMLARRLRRYKKNLAMLGLLPSSPEEEEKIKLGIAKDGEIETTGRLINVYQTSEPWFTVPTFETIAPEGDFHDRGSYSFIAERAMGVCVVSVINMKWTLLVKQHRFTNGLWLTEFPRGNLQLGQKDPAQMIVRAELPGLKHFASLEAVIETCVPKGAWQDSGLKTITCRHFLLCYQSSLDSVWDIKKKLEDYSPKKIIPQVFSLSEINQLEDQGVVHDHHSMVCWSRAKKYLREHYNIPIL